MVAKNTVKQKEKNSFTPPKDFCDFPQFSFGGAKEFLCYGNFRPHCKTDQICQEQRKLAEQRSLDELEI
jgi:hypothetical protein